MSAKDTKKVALKSLAKMSNADFLAEVAARAPQFKELAAQDAKEVFTEKGFEALQNIYSANGDPVSDFYNIALLVGLQYVDMVQFSNPLDEYGIIERFNMNLGAYMEHFRVGRIKNVNPGWIGLENGDSRDDLEVRKPNIITDFYGLNWNYQNWITLQDFDLKGGWLRESGIGETNAAIYNMIGLDRVDTEYAKFFEVLSGAINSVQHPLQPSQVMELAADLSTEAGVRGFIKFVKNVARSISSVPSTDMYNAAKYPNGNDAKNKMVILVREGVLSDIEDVLGYAFNPEKLSLPFAIHEVPNFGGMTLYDATGTTKLQVVYDKNGVAVGGVDAAATVNGYATKRKSDGRWIVNITSGGATADTTIAEFERGETTEVDETNADVVAVCIERGAIFELIQNEMKVEVKRSFRGQYDNTWFSQPNNGINYNHTKNLIVFKKPSN